MQWLNEVSDWFLQISHKEIDLDDIKQKMAKATATKEDLLDYVTDLEYRIRMMVKDLRNVYRNYNITFTGFRSLELACEHLRTSIKDKTEEAYNNLSKFEATITGEQQRHLALIRLAVTQNGKRVFEQINRTPEQKKLFDKVFGSKDANGNVLHAGLYQQIWTEIHKLAEYILLQKKKVYH